MTGEPSDVGFLGQAAGSSNVKPLGCSVIVEPSSVEKRSVSSFAPCDAATRGGTPSGDVFAAAALAVLNFDHRGSIVPRGTRAFHRGVGSNARKS